MTNVKAWIVLTIGFFLVAELLQWLGKLMLPAPLVYGGGVALAMAANWDRRAAIPFKWLDRWAAFNQLSEVERSPRPFHAPGSEVRSPRS